jgi:hypothetical protein
MATDDKPPIDLVAMRRKVADTYDMAIGMATLHLSAAEQCPHKEYGDHRVDDLLMDEHLRFAEVYSLLARACQKAPGSQF